MFRFPIAEHDAIALLQLGQKIIKLDALIDIGKQQRLQQRIVGGIAQFDGPALRYESDIAAVNAVNGAGCALSDIPPSPQANRRETTVSPKRRDVKE
jgi:hypothetical protein